VGGIDMSEKYNLLQDSLRDVFIRYQWRLDNPMPSPRETNQDIEMHYLTNTLFHAKVDVLCAGVIDVVIKWEKEITALKPWLDDK
jgi:hypothetical protein